MAFKQFNHPGTVGAKGPIKPYKFSPKQPVFAEIVLSIVIAVTGIATTSSVGTVTPIAGATIVASGSAITSAVGSVAISQGSTLVVSGGAVASSVGTASVSEADQNLTAAGNTTTSAVGIGTGTGCTTFRSRKS